jgi:hypothetical protein
MGKPKHNKDRRRSSRKNTVDEDEERRKMKESILKSLLKETLLALVRDLFTFSSKVIKRFIIV